MYKRGILFLLVIFVFISSINISLGFVDSDKDGLPNEYELENGLDYLRSNVNKDSDMDGLLDIEEYRFNSSPVNKDTDNDGYLDKEEFDRKSDPNSKFSPKYSIILKFVISASLIILIMIIIIIIFRLINPSKEKVPETKQDNDNEEKHKNIILRFFGALLEAFLGPSISKARKRDKQLEKKKLEGIEDVYLDSTKVLKKLDLGNDYDLPPIKNNEEKKVVFTPSNDDFDLQLKKVLRNNIRKNNVSDILGYFDKEMDNEELNLLKEKKSKKEISRWYNKRKEMRDKIIDLAKEEKESLKVPIPISRQSAAFDRLDEINGQKNN